MRDATQCCWLEFTQPLDIMEIHDPDDVVPALCRIEECVSRQGLYAAGLIAYEAAPAFDPALAVRRHVNFPLLWFGVYQQPRRIGMPHIAHDPDDTLPVWHASIQDLEYEHAFDTIKTHLFQGDIYQANYTYRLDSSFAIDPWRFFLRMCSAQGASYGAFIRTRERFILSASPELFFHLDGVRIVSRPMKGTIERGRTWQQDREQAQKLLTSDKERAENLMIVDMVRNDMGRIATPGSVMVPRLFELEKYQTLWQMTSTIEAHTHASVIEIFEALFPAASITGAPKHRAMQIIAGLESTPRRVYTGALGFLAPGRRAQFNVAIRTLTIDRSNGSAQYGVGGGIVWDSKCESEKHECIAKSRILSAPTESFALLETIRWTPQEGFYLLGRHLLRLAHSAAYFNYSLDLARVRRTLRRLSRELPRSAHKVRLLLDSNGGITCKTEELIIAQQAAVPQVALAPFPVDKSDPLLFHKTTRRRMYREALSSSPGYDDVILHNAQGEATETTIANLIVDLEGELITPPLECGLLPGTVRGWMLEKHLIREQVIPIERLLESPRIYLINSVRGMYQVSLNNYRKSLHMNNTEHIRHGGPYNRCPV